MKNESDNRSLLVIAVRGGVIGVTAFALILLILQLVVFHEPYKRPHSVLLIAAFLGFVAHVVTCKPAGQS